MLAGWGIKAFYHSDPSKKIKMRYQFAHRVMESFDVLSHFEYKKDDWYTVTRYYDENNKVLAIYDFKNTELRVYNGNLIEVLDGLNY